MVRSFPPKVYNHDHLLTWAIPFKQTSLLNALLGRTSPNLTTTGNVYFNGTKNPSLHKINTISGYVRQEDSCLLSHLTVRQTLRYAIQLCKKKIQSVPERERKVEEVMDLVGLRDCADVLVGDDETTGCSGGQRRRVSIGIQLVDEPACLFLDEPTTGLDARTGTFSLSVVSLCSIPFIQESDTCKRLLLWLRV